MPQQIHPFQNQVLDVLKQKTEPFLLKEDSAISDMPPIAAGAVLQTHLGIICICNAKKIIPINIFALNWHGKKRITNPYIR